METPEHISDDEIARLAAMPLDRLTASLAHAREVIRESREERDRTADAEERAFWENHIRIFEHLIAGYEAALARVM